MRAVAILAGGLLLAAASANAATAASAINTLAEGASCLIEANSVVRLSSSTQGTLAVVEVSRGDRVKPGDVVARLESTVEQTAYEAARLRADSTAVIDARQADVANTGEKLTRIRGLAEKGIAKGVDVEEAEKDAALARYALETAKLDQLLAAADAERLKAVLAQRIVKSPVEGVVTKVDLHAGEFADPSVPIATIAEIQPLSVEVYLPADAYPLVVAGMKAEVRPQEPIGGAYVAEVATKDPRIDSASGMFQLTMKLPNADGAIPAGLRCSVRFQE